MKHAPQISIILPVYNAERWLKRCIDSILVQTFTDFELLIIDDGSIDSSSTICDEYVSCDNRVRVFHKINGGVSSARNVGLTNAQGIWVTFCDADDYVFPEWLANFKLHEGQDCDLLTQGMMTDKPFIGLSKMQTQCGFDYLGPPIDFINKACDFHLLGYNVIKAFRRDIIRYNNLEFNERLWFREDEVFLLEYMSLCKKIRSSKDVGYFYYTPEWEKKYNPSYEERIYLEECTIEVLCKIKPSAYRTLISVNSRNALNKYLTEAFYKTKNLKYVRKLLMYYTMYPDFARLNRITLMLMQKAPSCKISGIVLYIHMCLRNLLNVTNKEKKVDKYSNLRVVL